MPATARGAKPVDRACPSKRCATAPDPEAAEPIAGFAKLPEEVLDLELDGSPGGAAVELARAALRGEKDLAHVLHALARRVRERGGARVAEVELLLGVEGFLDGAGGDDYLALGVGGREGAEPLVDAILVVALRVLVESDEKGGEREAVGAPEAVPRLAARQRRVLRDGIGDLLRGGVLGVSQTRGTRRRRADGSPARY